jgi:hypothetical protein
VSFAAVAAELGALRWGSASAWSDSARQLLLEYYRRLGPFWPAGRERLEPADRAIEEMLLGALSDADRERVRLAAKEILDAAKARGERVESTTRKLVPLILAWALAVERGALAADADPGAPLLELFRAGFQIAYTHAGIELWYATGSMTAPVPGRPVQ